MKLTTLEVKELCDDFKELVNSGDYSSLLDLDLKLLSIKDCVLFYRRFKKNGTLISEEVRSVHRDYIITKTTTIKDSKVVGITDSKYDISELSNFTYLLAPNKVVMSEIGKYYKNRTKY